jgi:hypothetical protein
MELIMDSARHSRTVRRLMAMVKGTPEKADLPLRARQFNLRNKADLEMMTERGSIEHLTRDICASIIDGVEASGPGLPVHEEDRERFLAHLGSLVKDETRPAEMVAGYVGKVERIR